MAGEILTCNSVTLPKILSSRLSVFNLQSNLMRYAFITPFWKWGSKPQSRECIPFCLEGPKNRPRAKAKSFLLLRTALLTNSSTGPEEPNRRKRSQCEIMVFEVALLSAGMVCGTVLGAAVQLTVGTARGSKYSPVPVSCWMELYLTGS